MAKNDFAKILAKLNVPHCLFPSDLQISCLRMCYNSDSCLKYTVCATYEKLLCAM